MVTIYDLCTLIKDGANMLYIAAFVYATDWLLVILETWMLFNMGLYSAIAAVPRYLNSFYIFSAVKLFYNSFNISQLVH